MVAPLVPGQFLIFVQRLSRITGREHSMDVTDRLDWPDRSLVQVAGSLDNPVGGLIAVSSVLAPNAGRMCIGSPRAANARKEWTLDVRPRRLCRQTGVDGMERCWSDGNVECPSTARSHPRSLPSHPFRQTGPIRPMWDRWGARPPSGAVLPQPGAHTIFVCPYIERSVVHRWASPLIR